MSAQRVERLEKALARVAREHGLDQERLRRWVSFLALCGVLERAIEHGVIHKYYLKGGVALELRFAGAARTTKDFDLGLEGDRTKRMTALERVLKLGFDELTFRLKPQIYQMELSDTVRVEVAVQYRTRAWQTVDVDLGPAEATDLDFVEPTVEGLAELGLKVTSPVRCLGIDAQIAQRLHACTAPNSQDRARDILDILLVDMLGKLDPARVNLSAQRIFQQRGTHAFPPAFVLPASWHLELETLARELGYPSTNASEIEAKFLAVLASIVNAPSA